MNNKLVAAGKSSFNLIDVEKTFTILDLQPDTHFLDLACGIGNYSLQATNFISASGRIYALDLWKEGLESLRQVAAKREIDNIEAIQADATAPFPLPDSSIDSCLIATALHDLPHATRPNVIEEVARVLKPDGCFNIIEFKKLDDGPGPPTNIRIDEVEVSELVVPLGFEKISYDEIGDFNYLLKFRKTR